MAGLLTAALVVPMTVSISEPLKASANELLGETSFDHKMAPWQVLSASPAKQQFDFKEGAAHMLILVPEGADREKWDLQFVHNNLSFKEGHEYKVSFKAKSNRNGMELCSYIGSYVGYKEYFELDGASEDMHMGPHMGGMWPNAPVKLTTDWQTFEGVFIPTEDIDSAKWAFQYARGTQYVGNAREGDEIWFDDMTIFDTTSDDTPVGGYVFYTNRDSSGLKNNYISVNQLGYYKGLAKKATLGDNKGDVSYGASNLELDGTYPYEIVRVSDDEVVYTGKTEKAVQDADSGDKVCKIDFTEFDEAGEYYLRIKDEDWRSMPFRIGDDIYSEPTHDMLTDALNFFYQNRSGIDIKEDYITSGDKSKLAHSDSHMTDTGYVQKLWKQEYYAKEEAERQYATSKLTASGGWYSSADHNKYMVEGGMALWTLQNMYERAALSESGAKKFADGSGKVSVPETGNDVPDILDECRYELDFMSKMKVQPDEKTWGKYAGLYYNSIQDHKWTGLAVKPWDYIEDYDTVRIVKPPTFAATLNYAACAAQAARLWQEYDPEYADTLLTSAKEAYDAYTKNWYEAASDELYNDESLYAPLMQMRTYYSEYDDEVRDDAYWAACELFVSASLMEDADAVTYLDDLSKYKDAFKINTRTLSGSDALGYVCDSMTMFNWQNTASAGSMTLLNHSELLDGEQVIKLNDSVIEAADVYIDTEEEQGYNIPYLYDGPRYESSGWGPYIIHYAGFEYCSNERAVNNMMAMAYAYDITKDKKYLNGVATGMNYLLGNNPMSYSFITGYGSYSVKNPTHRYWCYAIDKTLPSAPDGVLVNGPNSEAFDPYMRSLGFSYENMDGPSERYYADSPESWASNAPSLTSNASLAWVVSFLQDEAAAPQEGTVETGVSGDANGDGKLNTADLVVLKKWLLAESKSSLLDWKDADLCKDGVIDVFDFVELKKLLIAQ